MLSFVVTNLFINFNPVNKHQIPQSATVMDDAEVGEGALVAAGSVVLSKTKIGPHEMWAGAPAKFVKMMEPEKSRELNEKIARNYLFYSKWYTDPDNAPL